MKTINVKAYNTKKITKELPVVTNDGQPTIIKAEKGINYEFFDQSIGRAPNHIITKRSGKDLHVSFERDGKETDLIIEGFYDNEDHALIGIAEDGQYYYYIPDTGEVSEYVTQLVEGKVEGQALGGEHLVAPWWVALPNGAGMPWWLGLGVLPVLFSGDDDSPTNTPEPTPSTTISTSPNSKTGEPHQSVTQNVISNDKSVTHLNLSSLVIIDPKTGKPSTENNGDTLTIANQGVWSVIKDANGNKTGEIKFTPNPDFIQNPTPINYQVKDNAGNLSVPTPVAVIYNQPLSPDIKTGKTGTTVTQNVLLNDSANTTKDSLKLVDKHGNGVDSLHVDGQGVWTVIKVDGKPTGEIRFQPDAGFVGNPTSVQYQVIDNAGNAISTSVAVIYDNNPNITNPDVKAGKPGQPVTINATNNDGTVKPETIKLIDPNNPGSVDKPNLVDSVNTFTDDGKPEGTWQIVKDSTGKPTGEVLFTPAPTFLSEPKPINYVITGENGQVLPPTPIIVSYPPVPVAPATPPVAKDDTQTATAVGIATTVAVVGNDTDPNNNIDPTSVQIVGSTDGKTLVVNGEGTWTVDPVTGSITFKPEASFKGDPTPISYTVKDSTGLVSNKATVTIDYPQDKPVASNDTQAGTAVGGIAQPVTVNVLTNDTDPNNNIDPTSVQIVGSTDGKTLVVNGEGTWTVDPVTGSITFTPEASFKGDPTPISYTVKDSTGLESNPATVTIDYPQDKPVATNDTIKPTTAGTPVTVDVLGNDTDPNNNIDPTSVQIVGSTDGKTLVVNGQGTWTVDPVTGSITFKPEAGFKGDPTPISYTVKDSTGLVSNPATVTIDYPQDKPVATNDTIKPTTAGTPVTVDVLGNDSDPNNNIDPTSVQIVGSTDGKTLVVNGQGTWTVDPVTGSITFKPEASFKGDPTPISYTVKDSTGLESNPATVTIDYPQDKPVATNDTIKPTTAGTPVTVDVLGNDSDPNNNIDPTSVQIVGSTDGKTLVVNGQGTWTVDPVTGSITFKPEASFKGDPTPISYTVKDSTGLVSNPATVTIDYPQDKPVASNDTAAPTTAGTPVTVNVLGNDTDANNDIDPTTVQIVGSTDGKTLVVAGEGTWTVNPTTGEITFTPDADFKGDPTPISYTVKDSTGLESNPATVTVDYPQNKPVATNDTQAGTSGQPVVINVLSNDTDAQNDIDPSTVVLVGGTNGGKTLVVPNQGTWSVAADGKVTFTPVSGFTGDPTPISYTVADKTGLVSDPATITVDYPQNKPVATNDTQAGTSGQPVVINVLSNDTDAQNDIDPSTVVLVGGTNGGKTLVVPNQGTWSVAADGKVTFTPAAGFTGDPTPISYTVTDKTGLTSQPVSITLDYPQDKPTGTAPNTQADTVKDGLVSGQPITVNVLANDSDAQSNIDPTTVKLIDPATNTPATSVTVANQGTWSVDAVTGAVTFTPAAGFTGDPTPISYTVTDKTGLTSDPVSITLDYPQDKPTAKADTGTGATGQPVTVNVLANDSDAQSNIDPTTVKLIDPATNTPATSVTVANQGTWSVDAVTGAVTFTPAAGFTGDPTPISYTVTDKTGLTSDPVSITLDYPQDKPTAKADTGTGATGQPVTVNVLANDSDAQDDIDPTSVKLLDPNGNPVTTLDVPGEGSWTVNPTTGAVTFTPVAGFTKDPTPVSYTVTDKTGMVSNQATITVDYPNNAPVAVNDSKTTAEDTPATGNVLTNDSDVDNDTLTVSQFVVGGQTYTAGSTATIANVGTLVINSDGNYTFTPAANYNGTVPSVTYTVSDGKGANASAKLDITVTPVNDVPVAVDDTYSIAEDAATPLTLNPLNGDTDIDGDNLTITAINGTNLTPGVAQTIAVTNGTVNVAADGTITFSPAANYNGTVTIPYTISDGKGGTATANEIITVTPVNDVPVAVDDSKTTAEDTPATGNVLTNDSDVDNDTLTVSQFVVGGQTYTAGSTATIANVGTLVINSDGNYTFTPAANYNGTVPSVTYTVSDGKGANASAKLDITVTPVNDVPVAVDDTYSIAEDAATPLTLNPLNGDTDIDGDNLTITAINGTNLTPGVAQTIAVTNGTVNVAADGTITFSPAANYNGTVTIPYTISDGKGGTATANEIITVTPVNDVPVAVDDSKTTAEDTPATGNVLTNDSDVDNDTLTVSQFVVGGQTYTAGSTATIANVGTLVINSDGNYTFTPAANYNGTVPSVTYTVSDGKGANASAKLDITVTPVNDVPVAVDDTYSIAEDAATPLTLNPLNGDTDIDGDNLTITAINGTNLTPGVAQTIAVTNGTVNVAADGTITFSPAANYNGTVTIPYTISDGKGGTATANEIITVTPVNDVPVAVDDSKTTAEDTPATGNVLTNDSDVDNDTLTVSQFVVGGQTYTAGSTATIANVGTLVINSDGNYTFTPAANYNGTVPSVTYTVSDGKGANASAKLDITVTPVNDVPVAVDDSKTTAEDTPATGNVLTNDSDVDNDTLTVSQFVVGGQTYTAGSTATIANVGTLVINSDGNYTFTPAANYNGTVPSVTYTVSDGKGANASAKLDITVTPVNDVPVAVDDTYSIAEDAATPLTLNPLNGDTDIDGDNLTITAINGTNLTPGVAQTIAVTNGTVNVAADGTITFSPAANYNGTVTIPYTISDGKGGTATANEIITVTPVNDVPVAVDDSKTTAEDTPATGNVLTNDSDVDNDTLTVSQFVVGGQTYTAGSTATIANVGTLVINSDGNYTFTPAANYNGTVPSVTYTVSDGKGANASAKLDITVTPVNDVPVAVDDTYSIAEDAATPLTLNPLNGDTDIDGDNLTITAINGTNLTPGVAQTIAVTNGTVNVAADGTITFSPAANYNGTVTIPYTISDGKGGTATANEIITVTPVNDVPVAVDDSKTTAEDTPATGNVLTNDSDVDNDTLTVSQFVVGGQTYTAGSTATIANVGTLVINSDGNYTFTPAANYNGTVPSVTYTVSDGKGANASAKLDITVTPVNDVPVAVDDTYSIAEDAATPLTLNPLNGDTDIDGDNLTITAINGTNLTPGVAQTIAVTNGTVNVAADGTITFSPAANYNGTVTIPYTISDGKGGTATANEIITVTPVNDVPVAVDDSKTTAEDTPATGNVLTNDSDVDNDTLTVSQFVVGGQTYTAGSTATIANVGTLVINSDGNYTFTPAANYNGTVPSVTYTVSDGKGANASAKLDITVTPVNDVPVAVDDTYSIAEDAATPLTLNPLNGDTDIDGDNLTITAINGTNLTPGVAQTIAVTNGTVNVAADGTITFSPAANYNGTVTIPYTISDGKGGTATANEIITVTPVNDVPVAVDDTYSIAEDAATPLTLNPLNGDTDIDGDNLTITAINGTNLTPGVAQTIAVTNGTVNVAADGTITFSPAANYNGTVTIPYTISDGKGGTATANEIITVTPVNDVPVAVDDSKTTAEDTPATGNVLTNDSDVDNDTLTVSQFVVGGQTYTAGSTATIANVGTLVINSDGNYTFTPAANYNGTVPSVTYTVSDGKGANASAKLDITVTPVNDVPVAVDDTYSIAEDAATPLTLNPLNGDTDIDGDNLTITAINGTNLTPGVAQTIAVTNGTVNVAADGTITFSPAANYNGTVTIPYTISDGKGGTATANEIITVTPVNDVPVAVDDSKTTAEDTPATGNVLTNDSDVDNDTLTVSQFVVGGQTYTAGSTATIANVGTLVINSDGNYTFTPAANYNGTVPSVTYTVSDGKGANASAKLDITVTPVNDVPVAVDDTYSIAEDAATPLTLNPLNGDTDIDGDNLTITAINGTNLTPGVAQTIAVTNGTVNVAADGTITFSPAANYNGTVTIPYTISDGKGGTATANEIITVTPVNDVPVAVDDSKTTAEDTPATGNVLTNDSDVDNDTLTVSQFVVGGQTYTAGSTATIANVGTLVINSDGNYTFTPAANYNGTVPSVTYTVSDGKGANASAKLDITVTPVNDVPVAVDDTYSIAEDAATPLTLNPLNGDTDIDGDNLTITAINGTNLTPGVAQTIAVTNGTVNVAADGTITFSPAANYNGTVTIPYTISDGKGGTATANEIITVTPVNDVPVAVDDTYSIAEDAATPLTLNPLNGDTDIDGDNLTITAINGTNLTPGVAQTIAVTNGTVNVAADGTITFSPAANYNGTVTIPYTISDGKGGTATANEIITVTPVNDVPVAVDDSKTTAEDTPATGNVLTNDSDVDNDTLTVSQFVVGGQTYTAGSTATIANVGTLVINSDGNYTFTPAANYNGTVPSVTYTVSDGKGANASAKLDITVTPVNDVPVAVDDTYSIAEDAATPLTLNPLNGDTDIDGDNLTITAINGTNLTPGVAQTIAVTNGTVNVAADGTITFSPAANYNGTVTIPYTISDGKGGTATANEIITVTPVNDVPVAVDDSKTTAEDTPATGNVLTNDSDVDNDTLTVSQFVVGGQTYTAGSTATIANVGTLVINSDGNYTFTPAANYNGTVPSVTYTVSDGKGANASAKLDITVTPVNDVPVAVDDTYSIAEDAATPLTLNPLNGDTDIDGDNLTITAINGTNLTPGVAQTIAVTNGTVNVAADGTITFSPAANYNGTVTIPYTISDGKGGTATANEIITVTPVNDVPVAVDDSKTTAEDTPATGNVLTNDSDVDNDTLTVSQFVVGGQTYTAGSTATIANVGTLVINSDGNYTFTPAANYNGTVPSVTYTVSDGKGANASAKLDITVTPVNDVPVAVNDTLVGTTGQSVVVNVIGNDTDVENNIDQTTVKLLDPNGNPVTTLDVPGEGTWTVDPVTGSITFKPEASFKGDPTPISYTVKDSTGLVSNPATVTVDYPAVVLTSKLAVSEEALTYGIKDSVGNPTDTTDSAAATGSFGAATSAITTISAPTTAVYSGGEKVIWTSANGVLTGKTETTGVDVIKVTSGAFAAATGAGYTVTLLKAIDHPTAQNENTLDITFDVQTSTEMGQITLTVEDDAPVTTNATLTASSDTISLFYANVNLIMDLSGSTANASSIPGKTVFQAMKDSVNKLLDYYQSMLDQAGGNGDVRVDISVFASGAKHLSLDGSKPSYWVSLADAKKLLDTIQPPDNSSVDNGIGRATNYDVALQEMIKGYQQSNVGPLQNKPGLTNSAYFFTDGEPNSYPGYNPASTGINPGSFSGYVAGGDTDIGEKDWTDFLTANNIKAYAIGLGSLVKIANITPISYDGTTATNPDASLAKHITDFSQLDAFLTSTVTTSSSVPAPLTATGLIQSGADANYTASMMVDNITYTYQTSTGKITSDYAHTAWKDLGNGDLQVTTHSGGTVSLHLGQGANLGNMTYQASSSILTSHTSETISYTITDGDGDKASGTATIDLSALPKLVEHALQASTSTTVSGTANVADVFTLSGLTNNGSDTITNFEVGTDKLGFSGIKEISDLKNISAQASGGNTIVHFTTADTIASHLTLTGVTLATTTIQNWLVNNSVIM